MNVAGLAGLAVSLSVIAAGCSSARRGEPFTADAAPTSPQLERGAKVFYEHCHKCHTGGEAALGPALNNKPLPGFLLRFQVRRGLGAMPSFSEERIDDGELEDLVAYLQYLRRPPPRAGSLVPSPVGCASHLPLNT